MSHSTSVQFGYGSRHCGNPDQLDPAVYGQYRKAEAYNEQNDGSRRVSFEDDRVHAVRQSRDKTLVRPRPRSVTGATQWESNYASNEDARQSGLQNSAAPTVCDLCIARMKMCIVP